MKAIQSTKLSQSVSFSHSTFTLNRMLSLVQEVGSSLLLPQHHSILCLGEIGQTWQKLGSESTFLVPDSEIGLNVLLVRRDIMLLIPDPEVGLDILLICRDIADFALILSAIYLRMEISFLISYFPLVLRPHRMQRKQQELFEQSKCSA
jgi:hypothetical protein